MSTPTVVASWTRTMLECARAHGVDEAALLSGIALPPQVLETADARVPSELDHELWARAARLTGVPAFGLTVATRKVELGTFGVVGFVVATSPTFHEALLRLQELQQLVSDDGTFHYAVEQTTGIGEAVVLPLPTRGRLPPDLAEAILASIIVVARSCTGVELRPRAVRFQHARPHHARALVEFFGAPVLFGQPDNALVLPPEALGRPLVSSSSQVHDYLRDLAANRLRTEPPDTSLAAEVGRAIADAIEQGELGLPGVARRMNVGVRTLQRRLRDRGLRYHDLVDQVRAELARRYLAAADLPVREVATRLGFARRSAFRRAFRRWTGASPLAYRAGTRS